MSPSGFLDLAYLIEISIVFNLAYREVKPLFDKRQIKNKTQEIIQRPEVKNTIEYCKNNSNKLAEGVVSEAYRKFTSSAKTLTKKLDGSYLIKWINYNMLMILCILFFATIYQHTPIIIEYIADIFELVWWSLFGILTVSIVFPICLTLHMNKKIKSIYKILEQDSKTFLDKHSQYLAESAEKQKWK